MISPLPNPLFPDLVRSSRGISADLVFFNQRANFTLTSTRCPTTSSRCSGTSQMNESMWLRSRLDQSDPVLYRITSLHWLSDEVLQQELGERHEATTKTLILLNGSAGKCICCQPLLSRRIYAGVWTRDGRQIFLARECFPLRYLGVQNDCLRQHYSPVSIACYHERMRGICRRTWTWRYFVIFKLRRLCHAVIYSLKI